MTEHEAAEKFRNLGIPEFIPASGPAGSQREGSSFGVINQDVMISHLSFPGRTVIPEHTHDQLVISFVRNGAALLSIDGTEHLIQTGDLTILFPSQKHGMRVQDEPLNITEVIITCHQE